MFGLYQDAIWGAHRTIMQGSVKQHRFLFLQGPHGPFFHRLGRMLTTAGAQVWRVGFNRGDDTFWPRLCENTQMWYASSDAGVHLCQVSLKGLIGIR